MPDGALRQTRSVAVGADPYAAVVKQRSTIARVALVCATLGFAGCAATRYEAPPDVAPQPPEIMAHEAIVEGQAAEAAATAPTAIAPDTAAAPVPLPGKTVVPPVTSTQSQRLRPTARSTEEIRNQNASTPYPLDFEQRLDHMHDRIYTWGQGVVEATDHRFADKDKTLVPVPAAPFRLGVTLESIDRSGKLKFDLDADLNIALSLPNTEKRLNIFVTSDLLDEGQRAPGQEGFLRAGLRYQILRYLDFDVGVRVNVPPAAFVSVKWTREYSLGSWDFYPFAKVFAETQESLGYAAATTFDHWSGRQLLRSSTYAKWRLDRDRTEWSQTFIYARAHELLVPNRYGSYPRAEDIGKGWGLRLLASGVNAHEVSTYEAGVFFRGPTRNRWLYWHAEPLVSWDRAYRWSADPGIRIGIDALFWDLARPARR